VLTVGLAGIPQLVPARGVSWRVLDGVELSTCEISMAGDENTSLRRTEVLVTLSRSSTTLGVGCAGDVEVQVQPLASRSPLEVHVGGVCASRFHGEDVRLPGGEAVIAT
jgi:hypothetical protein